MSQYRPQNFSFLPPIVKNLLIINILLYLLAIALGGKFGINLYDILGLHYWQASLFRPYQWITYMFMHSTPSHLLFNMFALWMFGAVLENRWGPKRFLFYYIACGLGAAALHFGIAYYQINPVVAQIDQFVDNPTFENLSNFNANNDILIGYKKFNNIYQQFQLQPQDNALSLEASKFMQEYKDYFLNMHVVVGASGAIFGLLLAFGMLFPNAYIYLYFLFPIKAKYFVILYGLAELLTGIRNNPGDNVAHFAHLGGMLAGFLLISYWRRRGNL
ncbi:MAG: rhomboid family intramembrane serine protease [Chitinophagales bacterium]